MGFKSLVIRGLKNLWANLWTSQLSAITQNSCRPSKLTLTTNITGPGRGSVLAARRHAIYGLELVKNFGKTGTVTHVIRISLVCLVAGFWRGPGWPFLNLNSEAVEAGGSTGESFGG